MTKAYQFTEDSIVIQTETTQYLIKDGIAICPATPFELDEETLIAFQDTFLQSWLDNTLSEWITARPCSVEEIKLLQSLVQTKIEAFQ